MTDDMKQNDLQTLWTSQEETVDMDMIMDARDRLERGRNLGRALWNGSLGFLVFIMALLLAVEFTGLVKTGGWLSFGWAAYSITIFVSTVFLRKRNPAIESLNPAELLKHAIERAETNLMFARILYGVVPISAVIGGVIGGVFSSSFLNIEKAEIVPEFAVWLYLSGFGVAIIISLIFGLRLARQKQAELVHLRARLKEIEKDV